MQTFLEIRNDEERDAAEAHLIRLNQAPGAHENLVEITRLGELIEDYEAANGHTFATPYSLRELLEAEMYKRKLKQRGMAELLEVHETRLSEYMSRKRPISFEFAKKLFTTLHLDPEAILSL